MVNFSVIRNLNSKSSFMLFFQSKKTPNSSSESVYTKTL